MKKLLFLLCSILALFYTLPLFAVNCGFNGDVVGSLQGCFSGTQTQIVSAGGDLLVEGGFKTIILRWISTFNIILSVLAVGGIVWGGMQFVLSFGDEEKITKGKGIIKWSIIGFLSLVSASTVIALVVNIMFSLGK